LNEGFAGDVVSEGLLGRVEFDVVWAATTKKKAIIKMP
jgi:hypothetical protein